MDVKNIKAALFLLFVLFLTGCSIFNNSLSDEDLTKIKDPLEAVVELRKMQIESPYDIRIRSLLKQYEIKTAEHYYSLGKDSFTKGDFRDAVEMYEKGLVAMPDNEKLEQAISVSMAHVESEQLFIEAKKNYQVGKYKDAETLLLNVLEIDPMHQGASLMLDRLQNEMLSDVNSSGVIASKQKISLNFKDANIKTVFGFLAKSFNFNVVFDDDVDEKRITINATGITFNQAMSLIMSSNKMFYREIGNDTFLVSEDTKSKREQYDEYYIKTYYLGTVQAKDMSEIIKGILKVKKLVINESMNTLMIRDTQVMHGLIQKIIEVNDRRPAELLLEVEILEVNRSKAEQLGFDYGGVISESFPAVDMATSSISAALKSGTVTLPSVTFRYFKQDVDAETLANPKIRVLSRKEAKIHIGDRVPLRSSTIQSSTGQTQTTYEYSDIGIRLNVLPDVHFDNSVTIDLGLEVSSLGQNLGTPEEPTYSIGTRNTKTYMLLRDGETAVIGGLIRDEDRNNQVRVPGLGDIPVLGLPFRSKDNSSGRNDVLLTITPKVVRSWDIPRKSLHSIYSGAEDRYSDKPLYTPIGDSSVNVRKLSLSTTETNSRPLNGVDQSPISHGDQPVYQMNFDNDLYDSPKGDDFEVQVSLDPSNGLKEVVVPILFNPELLEVIDIDSISDSIKDIQKEEVGAGLIVKIQFDKVEKSATDSRLFSLKLRGKQVGISYLTIKQAQWKGVGDGSGEIESRASRIVIK